MATEDLAPGTGAQFGSFFALWEAQKAFGYGKRLISHCRSAHGGEFDKDCNACKEMQAKIVSEAKVKGTAPPCA